MDIWSKIINIDEVEENDSPIINVRKRPNTSQYVGFNAAKISKITSIEE